ncbi:MAG: UDP-N-acetylmuramoyl-tripeptide--D-alanyl-D-alanine ligase [Clostridiaceae bacterium]|nr:UDP-N-acetylmuramoyl-tripeptide--D-alanyl-D-alanine ligase [Clostridiaceae bacterium]
MEALKVQEILEATGGILRKGDRDIEITDICTDSRKAGKGVLFVPLKGERYDGHDFIVNALQAGAAAFITERDMEIPMEGACEIKVKDTLAALHDMARYYRSKFKIPFIAVTGSVGKTTTKEMVSSVMEQKFNVLKTQGNFNNEIGLPLTVFRLNSYHDIAVTEMGMSGFGEIKKLVSIVNPQVAIITNIGSAHIEKLGSQENILKAKMEVFYKFTADNTAILNGDDPLLYNLKGKLPFKTVFYGIDNNECDIKAKNIISYGEEGSTFCVDIDGREYEVKVPLIGRHNIYNALASIAAGRVYNMEMNSIIKGIALSKPEKMRLDIFEAKGIKVINDCYNASPESMKAALSVLMQIQSRGRKIAILGDMLEMGHWAGQAHRKVGEEVQKCGIDYLFTVGYNGKDIAKGAIDAGMPVHKVFSFDSNDEAIQKIDEFLKQGDVVLVKASRGMRMESISEHIRGVG